MPRQRLYQKRGRWYGDFRDYADVGGGQEALIPDGETTATKDESVAEQILARRLIELENRRQGDSQAGPTLESYMERHLEVKAGYRRPATVKRDRTSLERVLEFFGQDTRLDEIGVAELTDYISHRRQQPGRDEGTNISAQTIRHELHALSSLFKRAVAEDRADENPVSRLPEKPKVSRREKEWYEHDQAGRLIRAAKAHDRAAGPRSIDFMQELLATFLLTGGRRAEVLGLLRKDVDRQEGIVWFRANEHRDLKRDHARRYVPLWPQLEAILEQRLEALGDEELLFASPRTGNMLSHLRKAMRKIADAAGVDRRPTPTMCRHTYTAARLQTLDNGEPVSVYTVAQELGHRDLQQIEETYGHLMRSRYRADVVRFEPTKVVQMDQWRDNRSS